MSHLTPGPDHAAPNSKGALVARVRKFLVAALGTAGMVVATGVLEDDVEVWVNAALAVGTALGVYGVKNARTTTLDRQ